MKLSRRSEYALLALLDLAEYAGTGYVRAEQIAERKAIPRKYLVQIMQVLRNAGYIRSHRGAEGGYKLAAAPDKTSLADIIRLMDGALAPVDSASKYFYESTPIEAHPPLLQVFRDIRDYIADKLERTTLADLV